MQGLSKPRFQPEVARSKSKIRLSLIFWCPKVPKLDREQVKILLNS